MSNDILELNKKISIAKTKINFLKKKMSQNNESSNKRKKRAHKLITKGALLEMLGIDDEDNEIILGFLSTFPKDESEKKYYKEIGKDLFDRFKKKKEV